MNFATSLVLGAVSLVIGLGMVWFAMPNKQGENPRFLLRVGPDDLPGDRAPVPRHRGRPVDRRAGVNRLPQNRLHPGCITPE